MGCLGKIHFYCRGQTEEKIFKNTQCYCLCGHTQKQFYSEKGSDVLAVKGTIRNVFKGVAGPSCWPNVCSDDDSYVLGILTFLVRMPL
jgi:hypothetical protein